MTQSIFSLIDAYAMAAALRTDRRDAAEWAFVVAHQNMLDARAAVAEALGIPVGQLDQLTDDTTKLAEWSLSR